MKTSGFTALGFFVIVLAVIMAGNNEKWRPYVVWPLVLLIVALILVHYRTVSGLLFAKAQTQGG